MLTELDSKKVNGEGIAMKKKYKIISLFIIILVVLGYLFYDLVSVQLHELNGRGEFKQEFNSSKNEYVARSYLIDDAGATVRAQVRVGITSKKNAKKKFNDETIYWEINTEDKLNTQVIWLNEHIISVNDVKIDLYDKKTYYN